MDKNKTVKDSETQEQVETPKLRGWLLIIQILNYLGLIGYIWIAVEYLIETDISWYSTASEYDTRYFIAALTVFEVAVIAYVTYLLHKRRVFFTKFYIVSTTTMLVVDAVVTRFVQKMSLSALVLGFSLIVQGVIIAYLLRSKTVKRVLTK